MRCSVVKVKMGGLAIKEILIAYYTMHNFVTISSAYRILNLLLANTRYKGVHPTDIKFAKVSNSKNGDEIMITC